jgi:hypothetical protein
MRRWFWIVALAMGLMLGSVMPAGAEKAPAYRPEDLRMIMVMLPDGTKCGYAFVGNGKWVIPPQFEEAEPSFDRDVGLASVKIGGKYGFVNLKGQMVIPPQFDEVALSWDEDRMNVKIGDQTGFIDRSGKMVIGLQSGRITSFSEGLASIIGDSTKFIDKTGAVVFEVTGWSGNFSDGLAQVLPRFPGSLETGFIDKTGQMVIKPQAGLFMHFRDGLAPIKVGDKYGFIDKSGKVVIPAQFDCASGFRYGLAPVLLGGKIGFIDTQGQMVIQAQYEYPDSSWQHPENALRYSRFSEGHATVKWNGKFGIIDKSGNWLVQPIYDTPGVNLYSRYKVVVAGGYYYDLDGKKLDHYVNHLQDGEKALKNGDPKAAVVFFRAALKINPGDAAASWGMSKAEGKMK